jgi:predicted secreted Zn-dependent protease
MEAVMPHPEPAAMIWRKSSASNTTNCVEVRFAGALVFLRDSKDPAGAKLTFTADEWAAFVAGVQAHEFDLPDPRP